MKLRVIVLLILSLLVGPVARAYADETLLAVRKAFLKSTGKQWDDASEEDQKTYLEKFKRQEEQLSVKERMRIARGERAENIKQRNKDLDQRKLDRLISERERKKMIEQREFEREKQLRKDKFERAKQKIKEARQRADAK